MALKDLFRRRPKRDPDAKRSGRSRDEETLLLDDEALRAARDADRATGRSDAPTVMITRPVPDEPGRGARKQEATTEKLAAQDATVAVSIPDLPGDAEVTVPAADATVTSDVGTTTLEARVDATVAVDVPDPGDGPADTQPMRSADSDTAPKPPVSHDRPSAGRGMSQTLAIPNFRPASEESASEATVAVPIPDFDEVADDAVRGTSGDTGRLAPPDATVAVPRPDLDAEQPASADATVAVSIEKFDADASGADVAAPEPGPADATVAVPIPDLDAREPADGETTQAKGDSALETRFDLPHVDGTSAAVGGVLVGIDGELAGTVLAIREGETKLGRSQSCDVVLASMKISREHCTIVAQEGVFAILPLAERNPTYVNGEVINGCELRDGDAVRMGSTTFRFRTIPGP